MEPYYRDVAKEMLDLDHRQDLPESLELKLSEAERLIKIVKPQGCLSSTQVISSIILMWELEETMKKFTVSPRHIPDPTNEYDPMEHDQ